MGDQQQKIDALRAAMASIQERDPDDPVPDFLVVDTSGPAERAGADVDRAGVQRAGVDGAGSADSVPTGAAPAESAPGESWGAETPSTDPALEVPELEGSELEDIEPGDIESGDLERAVSTAARPLVDPDPLPTTTVPFGYEAEDDREDDAADEPESSGNADEARSGSGEMSQLSQEEQYEKARAVVLRRLTGSPKSRHQLAVALKEKEFSPGVITRVLDRMEEVHLINDTEFARTWVKGRHELKNLGRSALRRELREKGISDHVAQDALEQISAEDEGDAARELVRGKLHGKTVPSGPGPEERAERDKVTRRLVSMLARRGHAPGAAFQIVREVIEDHSTA